MGQQVKVYRTLEFRRGGALVGDIEVLPDGRIQQTFGENLTGVDQLVNQQSATQNFRIGTRRQIDNRIFYYAQANSVQYLFPAYGVYNINTMSETGTITAAVAKGANTVTLTAVGTVTANQFQDGWLVVESGTYGYFPYYQIKSNTAGASTYTVTIYDKFQHAMSTSDETVSVMANEFKGVDSIRAYIVENNDPPPWRDYVSVVGVPLAVDSADLTITKSYYFWAQTWGPGLLMMVDNYGAVPYERNLIFYQDGSVMALGSGSVLGAHQHAGHLLPNAYYDTAGHYEMFCQIEISP